MDLKELENLFGKGTFIPSSQVEPVKDVISTGSLTLDIATGIMGIPKEGKITQIVGDPSTGKTTLCLNIIANEQKKGGVCCIFDTESSFDKLYASILGVDTEELLIVDPTKVLPALKLGKSDRKLPSGEDWLELLARTIESDIFDCIVFDGLMGMAPSIELSSGLGQTPMATMGRMFAQAARRLFTVIQRKKGAYIFTNQWRSNPGNPYSSRVVPGGNAIPFLLTMNIELSRVVDKDGKEGQLVTAKIQKNKVGVPFKVGKYQLEYGVGVVKEKELFDLAMEYGFITRGGAWYTLDEGIKLQGEDSCIEFLKDNPEFALELENKIKSKINETV